MIVLPLIAAVCSVPIISFKEGCIFVANIFVKIL